MHKTRYVSGFLIHLASEQILLQQNISSNELSSSWLLFEKAHTEEELPEKVFSNIIADLLNVKLDVVYPVYSYENGDTTQYIFYSELESLQDFSPKNGRIFNWFSFKEADKLKIGEQTKHDIVVGQRVINAESRKRRGEHTFQ